MVWAAVKAPRSINQALQAILPELLQQAQVLHLSGSLEWALVERSRSGSRLPVELQARYRAYPYLHEEMGAALQAADLVVSRAGASVLGEYPLFGLPAILVPYPYAWRYQQVNAQYLVQHGAAVLLEDADLAGQLSADGAGSVIQPGTPGSDECCVQGIGPPTGCSRHRSVDPGFGQLRKRCGAASSPAANSETSEV